MGNNDVTTKIVLAGDESGAVAALARTQTELKKTETGIAELSSRGKGSVDRLQNAFDTLNIKSGLNIDAERARIIGSFELIKNSGVASANEITRANVAMKAQLRELDSATAGVSSQFGGLSKMAGLTGVALGGMGVAAIASQLHQAGMAAERLRNSFEAATGSAGKGASEYEFARSEAQRLGMDLQSVADGYLKITANAKGTSLAGEESRHIFSSVAGASRSLGLSAEETNGILRALGQMMSKGTVQSEELKSQVGEHLPGAFQIAARAMGVSTAELSKMLEGGKVIADDFLPKFAAELEKTFPPGEKAISGMTAETERLKTAWFELKTTVMDNGGDSMFTGAIHGMRGLIVEADTFYSRMTTNIKFLRDFAKNPMNPNLIPAPIKQELAPVTKADRGLILGSVVGGSEFSSFTDRTFTPEFTDRMRSPSEYTEDFGSSLNRNPAYEDPKKKVKRGSKVHPKDLLKEQILSYRKDMERINTILMFESGAMEGEGDFGAAAFDLNGGLSVGDRYTPTAPMATRYLGGRTNYSLLSSADFGVKGAQDPEKDQETALKDRYAASAYAAADEKRRQDSLEAERGFLAQRAALTGDSSAQEILKIDREREALERSWAMNTDSFEVYEARMLQITSYYEAQKTRVKQSESQKQMQLAAGAFGNMATIADAFYQLSGKKSKEAFKVYQITKSIETGVTTHSAAMKAYDAMAGIPIVGPELGVLAAAAAYAAGTAAIAGIWSGDVGGSVGGSSVSASSASGSTITQPVSNTTQQQAPAITINLNGTTLADPQALIRWTEDYLTPTLRDLKTRGVTA